MRLNEAFICKQATLNLLDPSVCNKLQRSVEDGSIDAMMVRWLRKLISRRWTGV